MQLDGAAGQAPFTQAAGPARGINRIVYQSGANEAVEQGIDVARALFGIRPMQAGGTQHGAHQYPVQIGARTGRARQIVQRLVFQVFGRRLARLRRRLRCFLHVPIMARLRPWRRPIFPIGDMARCLRTPRKTATSGAGALISPVAGVDKVGAGADIPPLR